MSLVLEMYWLHCIQFERKVTIHTYLTIQYNSYHSIIHNQLWPELCRKPVHHEYRVKTEVLGFQRFNHPQIMKALFT
jgi:hypothetical protein